MEGQTEDSHIHKIHMMKHNQHKIHTRLKQVKRQRIRVDKYRDLNKRKGVHRRN